MIERENADLRERIAFLEAALFRTEEPLPFEWGLTASEARVFGVLANRDLATRDVMMAALYRQDGRDEAAEKIVDVYVFKLRKKLAPFGIRIRTHWGTGWSLDPESRKRFRARAAA